MAIHCRECGKSFGGVTPFDKHRVGQFEVYENGRCLQRNTRRCMTDAEMRASGMEPLTRGLWGQRAYPIGVTTLSPSPATLRASP